MCTVNSLVIMTCTTAPIPQHKFICKFSVQRGNNLLCRLPQAVVVPFTLLNFFCICTVHLALCYTVLFAREAVYCCLDASFAASSATRFLTTFQSSTCR